MARKAALHNLGCKVNAYELEAIGQMLEREGYEIVPFEPGADVYIINTCTVTNIADRKSRQMLHKAKKMNPAAVVVAAGCYVQNAGEELKKDEAIDLIIGNNRKKELPKLLDEFLIRREGEKQPEAESFISDLTHEKTYEELEISRTEGHTRAFIKVQDGCNQFCTYCYIPYARGRVRSREPGQVIEEAKRLAESGTRELVITGIHISSYGIDFKKDSPYRLINLLQDLHRIPGILRIRLGSLEPGIITPEFAEHIAAMPKICPHFHLSLQSGSETVLLRMNRRYSAAEYAKKCALLRTVYDNPALTTDVIVGFPGETEEEFEESYRFVEQIRFFETHIFKYSRREGTKAAAMNGQIPESVKTERSHILLELDAGRREEYCRTFLNREAEVLMEEEQTLSDGSYWCGYTKEYIRVAVHSEKPLMNHMVSVNVTEYRDGCLIGTINCDMTPGA